MSSSPLPHAATNTDAVITLREPRAAWLAPTFIGAMFVALLLLPPLLSDEGSDGERSISLIAGVGGALLFLGMALQARLRVVRCDGSTITVSQPLWPRRALLCDVRSVVRRDQLASLRAMRQRAMPRRQPKPFEGITEVIVYGLHDQTGKELLTLSNGLTPKSELQRLLARIEQHTRSRATSSSGG